MSGFLRCFARTGAGLCLGGGGDGGTRPLTQDWTDTDVIFTQEGPQPPAAAHNE